MSERTLKILELIIKIPKYLISSVHGITTPFAEQQELFPGPVLRQHDFWH